VVEINFFGRSLHLPPSFFFEGRGTPILTGPFMFLLRVFSPSLKAAYAFFFFPGSASGPGGEVRSPLWPEEFV